MTGYTKLFSNIVTSTIWQEDLATKVLWITMLALKDRNQVVEASVPGLAKLAGMSVPECEVSLGKLLAPDEYSRSREHEGRRIEPVEGGWKILNGEKYRDKMSYEERKEYKRIKQAEYRRRRKWSKTEGKKEGAREAIADGMEEARNEGQETNGSDTE